MAVVEDAVQARILGFTIGGHEVFLVARVALVHGPQNVSVVVAIELTIHIAAKEVGNLIRQRCDRRKVRSVPGERFHVQCGGMLVDGT